MHGVPPVVAMAIGNINAKIVNRMNMMCVVDSQNQHPFMVACLLNAVSLRVNTCIKSVLLMQSLRFFVSLTRRGLFTLTVGKNAPYMDKLLLCF